MNIDEEVVSAIKETVSEFGQSEKLVSRLLAWLDQLSSGQVKKEDETRQLDLVMKAINIEDIGCNHEN